MNVKDFKKMMENRRKYCPNCPHPEKCFEKKSEGKTINLPPDFGIPIRSGTKH